MSHEFAGAKLEPGQANALVKILGGMEVVLRLLSGAARVAIETVKHLMKIGDVDVPDVGGLVITKELLRERFNIKWFGDNFRRLLLGKTLKEVEAQKLALHKLQEYATGQQIKDEIGCNKTNFLPYLFSLVEQQKNGEAELNGEPAPLLVNYDSNIIIVELEEADCNGGIKKTAWAVCADFGRAYGYWGVEVDPLSHEWRSGSQVLSYNSVRSKS